ncbi:DUF4214 domain-containing protein [Noviherbaspirillum sp.]|uniref:DUF4214 domain-containing protein n=1 Tax=Noviherbaspirillum sp. TaxID=1926288 RepID=UPI002FE27F58
MKVFFAAAAAALLLAGCGGGSADTASLHSDKKQLAALESVETMAMLGSYRDYSVTQSGTEYIVRDRAGTRLPVAPNIKRLVFPDGAIALDITGNAGQAYRLYQAAFNRKPDLTGLGVQVTALDRGVSLLQIAQNFMESKEFTDLYGSNLSSAALVTQLYRNVLHREPEPAGFAHWMNQLDNIGQPRHEVLMFFSESAENQAQVMPAIQNGILYMPLGVPEPPAPPFTATLASAPPPSFFPAPQEPMNFTVTGSALENVELVSANDPSIIYGRFTLSPDKTSASLTFHHDQYQYGSYNLRILAWNAPPGQGGQMIEVMPPRVIYIHRALGCQFTPGCGGDAP